MSRYNVELTKCYELTLATEVNVEASSEDDAIALVEAAIENEEGDLWDEIEGELGEDTMDFNGGTLFDIDGYSPKVERVMLIQATKPALNVDELATALKYLADPTSYPDLALISEEERVELVEKAKKALASLNALQEKMAA